MTNEEKIADLKAKISEELRSVPMCVRSGGQMMAHEWKNRAEAAVRLCNALRPKVSDLENALFLLRTINLYQPRQVPMTEQGRMR